MIVARGRGVLVLINVSAVAVVLGGPGLLGGPPTGSASPMPAVRTVAGTVPGPSPVAEVVRITNVERARAGCPALLLDSRLATAAQLHSEDMAANNYFSHTSQDGRSFVDRVRAQGFGSPAAENIARGQRTPASVMSAWMNSAGHRRNILNCTLRAIGVGFAPGNVWTQDFGR